jgi:hypothetical protein
MGRFVKNITVYDNDATSGVALPSASTAMRPVTPAIGTIRFNTTSGYLEYFDGVSFKSVAFNGTSVTSQDIFTGDGSTTLYTLSKSVGRPTDVVVVTGNVYQVATVNYNITGNQLEFTSPPPLGHTVVVVYGYASTTAE